MESIKMESSSADYDKWKLRAAEQQQTFCSLFVGNRHPNVFLIRDHNPNFEENLQRNISFAVYARSYSNCTTDQKTRIDSIIDKIQTLVDDTIKKTKDIQSFTLNHIYISTSQKMNDGIIPLLIVEFNNYTMNNRMYRNLLSIIETEHVIYSNLSDYLENNKLSEVSICYPKDGIYQFSNSGRVMVEYRNINSVHENSFKPLDPSLFFPLSEAFSSQTLIDIQWPETHVSIKTLPNAHYSYGNLNPLATWFKLITSPIGNVSDNANDSISLVIETRKALKAIEFYKLFYVTPYNINCHFAAVHLMKILTIFNITGKIDAQLLNEFINILKFITNIALPTHNAEELIVVLNQDHSRLNNLFNVHTGDPCQLTTIFTCLRDETGILKTLDLIAKPLKDTSTFTSQIKSLILKLIDIIIKKKKTNVEEFAPLASSAFQFSYYQLFRSSYQKEIKTLKRELSNMFNQTINTEEYVEIIRNKCHLPTLKVIFDSVKKVGAALMHRIRNVEQRFLKFVFTYSDPIENCEDVIDDMFLSVTAKFIARYHAFHIESETKPQKSCDLDHQDEFDSFLMSLKNSSNINDLLEEYKKTLELTGNRINKVPFLHFRGMRVEVKHAKYNIPNTTRAAFNFVHYHCQKTILNYLEIDKFPDVADYHDRRVCVFSNKQKFVLIFFCDSFGIIVMFEIPSIELSESFTHPEM